MWHHFAIEINKIISYPSWSISRSRRKAPQPCPVATSRAGACASCLAVWFDDSWKMLRLPSNTQFHERPLQCQHCSGPASKIACDPIVTHTPTLQCELSPWSFCCPWAGSASSATQTIMSWQSRSCHSSPWILTALWWSPEPKHLDFTCSGGWAEPYHSSSALKLIQSAALAKWKSFNNLFLGFVSLCALSLHLKLSLTIHKDRKKIHL